jgi:signal transduction histidine kinase
MDSDIAGDTLASTIAERLRDAKTDLAGRWLARITERIAVAPNRVFPTEALLDHVPLLIVGIADFIEDPRLTVAADSEVMQHAMALGALRHQQGFTEYEILKEFEIFGAIVFAFLRNTAERVDGSGTEWTVCAQRLFQAVVTIQQATTVRYFELMAARIKDGEDRLRAFDRALTHEMRNRIGATLGAAELIETIDLGDEDRRRLAAVIARNARSMRVVLDNLLELAHLDADARQQRRVLLAAAIAEATRQLRDAAAADGVEIRVASDLAPVEVSAAAVELALVNYLSNAIKYRDPAQSPRFVEIVGRIEDEELVVRVRDNGIGVPADSRAGLFQRFFRARTTGVPEVEGTGLGLNIVREVIHHAGGRTWAEFPAEGGSVFAFALPARRAADGGATPRS